MKPRTPRNRRGAPAADPSVDPYTAAMGSNVDDHSEPIAVASFATAGEAEVAQAKLRGYGIESALDDQIEGGTVTVDGELGVNLQVRATDADDARRILGDDDSDTEVAEP